MVSKNPQDRGNRKILVKSFGENHDIKAIQSGVAKMHSSTIQVASVNSDPKEGSAATIRPDNTLQFSKTFFNDRTPSERTGTLIHEASHALLGAHDYFENHSNPQDMKAISRTKADQLKRKAASKGKSQDHYVLAGCESEIIDKSTTTFINTKIRYRR